MAGDDIEQIISIIQAPFRIDHHQTIAITVQRNADVSMMILDCLLQIGRCSCAIPIVDDFAVRLGTNRNNICP